MPATASPLHVLAHAEDGRHKFDQVKATVVTAVEAAMTPTSEPPHVILDWNVDGAVVHEDPIVTESSLALHDLCSSVNSAERAKDAAVSSPAALYSASTQPSPSTDFVPMETALDDVSRKMYSIVRSHLLRCKSDLDQDDQDVSILHRALDRANQRIDALERDNERLADALVVANQHVKATADEIASMKEAVEASRLNGLLHHATLHHVDTLRQELRALQQASQHPHGQQAMPWMQPALAWPPEIEDKLGQVDRLMYMLHTMPHQQTPAQALDVHSPSDHERRWPPPQYQLCQAMESRVHQLIQEMYMATQHMADFRTSVAEHVLQQLHDTEAVLRREMEATKQSAIVDPVPATTSPCPSGPFIDPPKFRKCTVPDCPKGVRSRGLCKGHGGGKRCEVPGCDKSNQGGGFCIAHGGGKRCSVDGCKSAAQLQGNCKAHRQKSAGSNRARSSSSCSPRPDEDGGGGPVDGDAARRDPVAQSSEAHVSK